MATSKPDDIVHSSAETYHSVRCLSDRLYASYSGKISREHISRWLDNMHKVVNQCNTRNVEVCVNSFGGDPRSAAAAVDYSHALQQQGYTVATIVRGSAMSAGYIMAAGMASAGMRYITPHSFVLLHQLRIQENDKKTYEHIVDTLHDHKLVSANSEDIITGSGVPSSTYNRYTNSTDRNWQFSAAEALDHKLVDHIDYEPRWDQA